MSAWVREEEEEMQKAVGYQGCSDGYFPPPLPLSPPLSPYQGQGAVLLIFLSITVDRMKNRTGQIEKE